MARLWRLSRFAPHRTAGSALHRRDRLAHSGTRGPRWRLRPDDQRHLRTTHDHRPAVVHDAVPRPVGGDEFRLPRSALCADSGRRLRAGTGLPAARPYRPDRGGPATARHTDRPRLRPAGHGCAALAAGDEPAGPGHSTDGDRRSAGRGDRVAQDRSRTAPGLALAIVHSGAGRCCGLLSPQGHPVRPAVPGLHILRRHRKAPAALAPCRDGRDAGADGRGSELLGRSLSLPGRQGAGGAPRGPEHCLRAGRQGQLARQAVGSHRRREPQQLYRAGRRAAAPVVEMASREHDWRECIDPAACGAGIGLEHRIAWPPWCS